MQEKNPDFYLTSSDGYGLEEPRACWLLSRHTYEKRDDFALVNVSPPITYFDKNGNPEEVSKVLIASREAGISVFTRNSWPICVYVCKINTDNLDKKLYKGDLINFAWAEIYPTQETAAAKPIKL